ncbi:MAG: dTDP-4-amino-4,6-dideoxygalactose transaminase, partial [Pseudohongiellaceae bacterium]
QIYAQVHYIPIHWQPYYQALGFQKGDYPQAEYYYQRALSLPLFPGMTAAEQQQVIAAVKEVLQ